TRSSSRDGWRPAASTGRTPSSSGSPPPAPGAGRPGPAGGAAPAPPRGAGASDTVGIGVPGLYEASSGTTTFLTNMPGGWRGVPVVARLSEGLGVPAALINDARGCALAESQLGAARGRGTAVFVAIGTGVGGGITIGGSLYEGREGRAGGIGHVTSAGKGPPCPV